MYATPEDIAAVNKANFDALLTVGQVQFATSERLLALSFNAAKAAFEDGVDHAKSLLSVKDAREFLSVTAASAQPAMEKSVAYSRSAYEVAAQARAQIKRLAESRTAEMNRTIASILDAMTRNASAGSETAVTAVKSAHDNCTKAMKQAAGMGKAGVAAASGKAARGTGRRKAA